MRSCTLVGLSVCISATDQHRESLPTIHPYFSKKCGNCIVRLNLKIGLDDDKRQLHTMSTITNMDATATPINVVGTKPESTPLQPRPCSSNYFFACPTFCWRVNNNHKQTMGKGKSNKKKKSNNQKKSGDNNDHSGGAGSAVVVGEDGIYVDPRRVRFQHSRIRPYFSGCGRSVEETLESIRRKEMSPSDLPPIQVRKRQPPQQKSNVRSPLEQRPISATTPEISLVDQMMPISPNHFVSLSFFEKIVVSGPFITCCLFLGENIPFCNKKKFKNTNKNRFWSDRRMTTMTTTMVVVRGIFRWTIVVCGYWNVVGKKDC